MVVSAATGAALLVADNNCRLSKNSEAVSQRRAFRRLRFDAE
jgi:hypothetical protein